MELLLLSNSTLPGKAWLEHALPLIAEQLQGRRSAVFIPFAGVTQTWDDYTAKTAAVLASLGVSVTGIHSVVDPVAAIENAEIVIVGGGNTFQLLKQCRERGLLAPITDVVKRGALYIGWSAGANLAWPRCRRARSTPTAIPPLPASPRSAWRNTSAGADISTMARAIRAAAGSSTRRRFLTPSACSNGPGWRQWGALKA